MAPVAIDPVERRRETRCPGGGSHWHTHAVLRPGQPVILLNISSRAALVESGARLRPGAHTEVQLAGPQTRARVGGRLVRCYVAAIEPAIRYRGVLIFDEPVDVGDDAPQRGATQE
jgi:hypothetical protein